jgi:predicted nucleic acid-binding protein
MSAADFLDTNILVYAYHPRDPRKQRVAQELVDRALDGEFVVSTQVLSEFAAAMLHKVSPRATTGELIEMLDAFDSIRTVTLNAGTIRRAVEASRNYGLHFYDGLIVSAAEQAACKRLWSEDLNSGQTYFGVTVHNPFSS